MFPEAPRIHSNIIMASQLYKYQHELKRLYLENTFSFHWVNAYLPTSITAIYIITYLRTGFSWSKLFNSLNQFYCLTEVQAQTITAPPKKKIASAKCNMTCM